MLRGLYVHITADMRRDTTTTADDLDRPDGNSLEANYSLHDVAQEHVVTHVEDMGLEVEEWGIDERGDDGDEGLIFDDKCDLKILESEDCLVALTEIKTKSSENWFGIINLRHYKHYLALRNEFDKPVYIYMALLDDDTDDDNYLFDSDSASIVRDAWIPLHQWHDYTEAIDDGADPTSYVRENIEYAPQVERTFSAPDGNQVVKLDPDTYVGWTEFAYDLGKSVEDEE